MPRNRAWGPKWKGGRTYTARDGKTVYVLRKMLSGRTYTIHLDARSEQEAEAELALFLRDPDNYRTRSEVQHLNRQGAVHVDAETVARYLEHLRREQRSTMHIKTMTCYLADWAKDLAGRDLRTVTASELRQCLNAYQAARKHRIVSIKSFCRYLRDVEGKLEASNDASLSLRVPPPRPEKALREKGYTIEAIEKLYQALGRVGKTPTMQAVQSVRDILCLHAKTGMHGTEVERLAKGEGKVTIQEGHGEIAATIKFIHKSGRVHVQSIDHQTLAAVQRLQARGVLPSNAHIRNVVFKACDAIGIERVTFGELRHSFVTWASERGEEVRSKSGGLPLSVIAVAVGHHSAATTKRFYDNVKVPPMIKIPIKLENPDDPPYEFSASAVSA